MEQPHAWQFGSFTLLPAQRSLLNGVATVRIGGRALDVLIVLVEAAGRVVGRDELMARVWKDVVVDEGSLRVHIAALRRALGDDGNSRRYIVNVAGRGYSFVGDAQPRGPAASGRTERAADQPGLLPPLLVPVIGRDEAIREVAASLADHRLVTIVGTGGIGKTTVALSAATRLAAHYRDGARFVDLAPLIDPRHVAVQVANAAADIVSDAFAGALPAARASDLGVLLANRQMLIVLDNCEHVVQSAATLAETLLSVAPGVRVLATSREPLRASGECLLRLSALELPPASAKLSAQQALGFSAVHLFSQRATATDSTFLVTDDDVPVLTAICRHLEGIPLAIELAAGRVTQLGLRGLLARLTDRFSVLTKGRRTALPRQQTLRATIDWSYDLLSEDQKGVLRRLSIFAGAFSFDSAVAVCDDTLSADACDAIDELVLKSLISVDTSSSTAWYRLLEVTRAYAHEKLREAGELLAVSRSHAEHVCAVFERLGGDSSLDRAVYAESHARWFDDIRLAVHASLCTLRDPDLALRLLAGTASIWYQRSVMDEFRTRAEEALEKAGDSAAHPKSTSMRLWHSLGLSYWHTDGSGPDAARAFGRAYEFARRSRDVDFERIALYGLWLERHGAGEYAAALSLSRQYAALTPPGSEAEAEILGRRMMLLSRHHLGDQAAAHAEASAALALLHRSDHPRALSRFQLDPQAAISSILSRVLWIQGRPAQALETAAEAVRSARATQHALTLCLALFGQCSVLLWCGRWADLGRQADAMMEVATERRLSLWKAWARTFKNAHAYGAEGTVVPRWRSPICGPLQLEMMATVGDELLDADALIRAEGGLSPWCAPEVFRAQGEKLLREGSSQQDGERWFVRALDAARSSGALSWELRAATSLARCRLNQDRPEEAAALLAGVLDRYTEGLNTSDVRRARLLQQG